MSQLQAIMTHLARGQPLWKGNAGRLYEVENLRSRIAEARAKGLSIRTRWVKQPSGERIAVYEAQL